MCSRLDAFSLRAFREECELDDFIEDLLKDVERSSRDAQDINRAAESYDRRAACLDGVLRCAASTAPGRLVSVESLRSENADRDAIVVRTGLGLDVSTLGELARKIESLKRRHAQGEAYQRAAHERRRQMHDAARRRRMKSTSEIKQLENDIATPRARCVQLERALHDEAPPPAENRRGRRWSIVGGVVVSTIALACLAIGGRALFRRC